MTTATPSLRDLQQAMRRSLLGHDDAIAAFVVDDGVAAAERALATLLAVPSAFTRPTGKAHWEVLLRARAVENGAYVFAPAQCGEHPHGRKTWGHSLIVDPWGEVLADGGEEPGFVIAEIDPARITKARRAVPSLEHDRPWAAPAAPALVPAAEAAKRTGS